MYYAKLAITSSLFIALLGCQPNERINELKSEIQDQGTELTKLNDSISTVNDSIRLATSIIQEQRELSESITDSVHDYIIASPVATAYIKTYDREPIEIVNDFFTTDNEASAEEKRRLFEELTNRLNAKKDELKELENDGIF